MSHTRSLFLLAVAALAATLGCGDRKPDPVPTQLPPDVPAPATAVAELTGWPAGLGRALVLRLSTPEDPYRLVVPELGDRRFADSAISMKVGDSIPVVLLGRRGKAGEAALRVIDAEVGAGSCVTWPAVEIMAPSFTRQAAAATWRIAAERDSVTSLVVDSLRGMSAADSSRLALAINSVVAGVPALRDSSLRGIPFSILRAYSSSSGEISIVAAELGRTTSSEADPREQRLFVVGERTTDSQSYQHVFSRDATGPADSAAVTELLVALVARQSRRPILVLAVESSGSVRLRLLERAGRGRWRGSWSSVVGFC